MIKTKIKIFREQTYKTAVLEEEINDWIKENNVCVVDFKTSEFQYYVTFIASYVIVPKKELLIEKVEEK